MTTRLARRSLAAAITAGALCLTGLSSASADERDTVAGHLLRIAHGEEAETADAAHPTGDGEDAWLLVEDDGDLTPVDLPAHLDGVESGAEVEATVATAPVGGTAEVTALTVTEAAVAATAATTVHHAYVVRVDDPTVTTDVAMTAARADVEGTIDYWLREARGAIGSFDIASTATLSLASSCSYGFADLWERAEALFPSVDFVGATNHLVVYTPTSCSYPYAGVATFGTMSGGGYIHMPAPDPSSIAHELGHNLGLDHSNLIWGDPYRDGEYAEYYGAFSPMAASIIDFAPAALSAANRAALDLPGVEGSTAHVALTPGDTSTQTVTLASSTAEEGTTAIAIADGSTGTTYYVDFRDAAGVDAGAFYGSDYWLDIDGLYAAYGAGVVVTWVPGDGQDYVFATEDADGVLQSSYREGDAFVAPDEAFTVDVVALSSTSATVEIATGASMRVLSSLALKAPATYAGSQPKVTATVTSSTAPTGTVDFYVDGAATAAATATVDASGVATATLPKLPRGTHALRAVYSGSDQVRPSQASRTLTVNERLASSIAAKATSTPYGTAGKVTVTVTGRTTPTGTVTVTVGSKVWTRAVDSRGKATVTLPKDWKPGTRTLTVRYNGDATFKASSTSVTATVVKATPKVTAAARTAVRKDAKATFVVRVASDVAPESGYVRLYVGSTPVSSKVKLVRSGSVYKVRVTTAALPQGRVFVKYYGTTYLRERKVKTAYTTG
ncbi:Ig-like domain repeat protein [Demequina iriomotensis]|uniref:Ig-like domain repeat protein n=1 Tax=Demequina iriomotensis TaxID=1536641 RepID=UPI000784C2BC|nr:Ig-like domain repeat protein [Demequina iriomotensis]